MSQSSFGLSSISIGNISGLRHGICMEVTPYVVGGIAGGSYSHGYYVFIRKTTAVRLSKEQLELMQDLVANERERIKIRKQEIIDEGARQGKTIPLAPILENLDKLKAEHQGDEVYIAEIERQKKELIEMYGAHIPVDEAYKIVKKFEGGHGST